MLWIRNRYFLFVLRWNCKNQFLYLTIENRNSNEIDEFLFRWIQCYFLVYLRVVFGLFTSCIDGIDRDRLHQVQIGKIRNHINCSARILSFLSRSTYEAHVAYCMDIKRIDSAWQKIFRFHSIRHVIHLFVGLLAEDTVLPKLLSVCHAINIHRFQCIYLKRRWVWKILFSSYIEFTWIHNIL